MSGYYGGEEGAWVLTQMTNAIEQSIAYLSNFGLNHLKKLFFAGFNILLAPILVFFILLYKQHAKDFIRRMFHHSDRQHLVELGRELNRSLERFLVGMLLRLSHRRHSNLHSPRNAWYRVSDPQRLLSPDLHLSFRFWGLIVAVIPCGTDRVCKSGDMWIIPKVCAVYFIINVIIEGNLIKPLVMRHTLSLNPLAVIFAVMAMGELLGFWGIILAIPTAAVVKICTAEMRELLHINGQERLL